MKKIKKVETVEALRELLAVQKGAIIASYKGLTVAEVTGLRKKLRDVKAEFRVVKNTLIRRAAAGTPFTQVEKSFKGPTVVAFAHGDPVAMAKVVKDFTATSQKVSIKAGYLDGKALTVGEVVALAEVPPREVLLGRLAGGLNGTISRFVQVIAGPQRKLAYALAAVEDQKNQNI